MLIRNAKIYDHSVRRFFLGDILVRGEKIAAVGSFDTPDGENKIIDANSRPVVPGFVDVHTHGRAGFDFVNDGADLSEMAAAYAKHGVTSVMPTLASAPLADMTSAARKINTFLPKENEAGFVGVHFEGRWLNPSKKGAHAAELLAPLNEKDLEDEVFRMCRLLHISAAFELDLNGSFAKKALSLGATLGLGHTAATYEQAKESERNGVTSYTHLFNAMPPLHHRDGGPICAAFDGNAFAELICDGIHISPEMVRFAYRNLGNDRLVLISDSMEATGMPDGDYSIAGNPVKVKNGKALTPEGALAGSTLSLDTALKNLMKFAGISLADALPCVTVNPAREIGVFDTVGSIEVGKQADILILSSLDDPTVEHIILRGTRVAF